VIDCHGIARFSHKIRELGGTRRTKITTYRRDNHNTKECDCEIRTKRINDRVRIFEWNNEAWNQPGDDIDGEAVDDWSGGSVARRND
jgi:hypothetical protein